MIGSHDAPTLIPLAWRQPPHFDHRQRYFPRTKNGRSLLLAPVPLEKVFLFPDTSPPSPNDGLGFRSFDELLSEPIEARACRSHCRHGGTHYKDATCGATGRVTASLSSAYLLLTVKPSVALTMNKETEQPAHVESAPVEVRETARRTFQC